MASKQWVCGLVLAGNQTCTVTYPIKFSNAWYSAVVTHGTMSTEDFKHLVINSMLSTNSQLVVQSENKYQAGFNAIIIGS